MVCFFSWWRGAHRGAVLLPRDAVVESAVVLKYERFNEVMPFHVMTCPLALS